MTKKLARLLRADIQETSDLKSIAKMLANKGRGGDTILAHITPKEVSLLKEAGGAGTVNPDTGLLEFYDEYSSEQLVPESYQPAETFSPEVASGEVAYSPSYTQYEPPAQVGTQDFYYQPTYPVELTSPEIAQAAVEAPAPANVFGVRTVQPAAPVSAEAEKAQIEQKAAGGGTAGADQRSFLQRFVGDPLAQLKATTGITGADLLRVGGAGAGAIVGRKQAQQAAKQIQEATQEQKNVGQPYQQAGQELQRAAMSGELTPQGAQAYQAMRAQMAQGVESRGGVGVAQAQAQIEAFRQQLLQNQYNLGLQVAQIGDNIALGAIRTGMQLDQQLSQANQQFYTQLAQIAGGGTYGYAPQQTRGTP
jgi:hypothetical protein